jgi:hypothetical protein
MSLRRTLAPQPGKPHATNVLGHSSVTWEPLAMCSEATSTPQEPSGLLQMAVAIAPAPPPLDLLEGQTEAVLP